MTRLLLTTNERTAATAKEYAEVFLWQAGPKSTVVGPLDPHLTGLGPVGEENVDFVRLALGVFSADRSVLRQARGSNWNSRDMELTVEVSNPESWQRYAVRLEELIGFLTGDNWKFKFTQAVSEVTEQRELIETQEPGMGATALLSGGADSAAGALLKALTLPEGSTLQLVSHFSANSISPFQKNLVQHIRQKVSGLVLVHRQINLNRSSKRLDGSKFKSEPSSRSRSLLFLSLGLAIAESSGQPLLIPENGFASLNPPLGPERRGSLSTHTTHPRFLTELEQILTELGAHGLIENPFQALTKGEIFKRVSQSIGSSQASEYLSATNSCSHTDARFSGVSPGSSCGVCFGCLVRRASFRASGLVDATEYLCDDEAKRHARFVEQKSIRTSIYDFAAEDPRPSMIMKMSLPAGYSPSDALDLCRRGVEELRGFVA